MCKSMLHYTYTTKEVKIRALTQMGHYLICRTRLTFTRCANVLLFTVLFKICPVWLCYSYEFFSMFKNYITDK